LTHLAILRRTYQKKIEVRSAVGRGCYLLFLKKLGNFYGTLTVHSTRTASLSVFWCFDFIASVHLNRRQQLDTLNSAMTAIRRKRDDDSTFQSNSQCSGSLANMDASQSSMVALDASTIGTDSSLPRRRRKRRRTTIVDALRQIDISNGERGVPNQILEHAVQDDNSQTLTSSESEGEDDDNSQILPPSDAEVAQRIAMRELVFGRPLVPAPPDPVDRKLQALVRKSVENVKEGQHPFALEAANPITESQDDMAIEPVYTRPSDPHFFDMIPGAAASFASATPAASVTVAGDTGMPAPMPFLRKRSDSLPEGLMDDLEDAPMEVS
jgi:hypothetical protein